jgi:hypothetical protein
MKVKALRYIDTKEFIIINKIGDNFYVFTSEIPFLHPETLNLNDLIKYSNENHKNLDINWDYVEIVELDIIESGVIGADIRNKLTPPNNLIAILEVFFNTKVTYLDEKRTALVELIQKEMKQTKKSIEYLRKLL